MIKKILYGISLILFIIAIFLAFKWKTARSEDVVPMEIHHPTTPHEFLHFYSEYYGVNESNMARIIKCESGWNTKAHLLTSKENSWGLSQINLKAHPEVSVQEATNPKFAIQYLTLHQSKKDVNWSCK